MPLATPDSSSDKGGAARPPVVSILMPVFNGDRFLAGTLRSIQEQSFRDFEVILVDDGSTDRTLDIAGHIASEDPRFRIVRHRKNMGPAAARNTAWNAAGAASHYIMNHDSDDISLPSKLERLVDFLERERGIDAVGSFADYIDAEGNSTGYPYNEWRPRTIRLTFGDLNSMLFSATLVRRPMFSSLMPFRVGYPWCDDYDFFARALESGYVLANIPAVLHRIRIHASSVGATRKPEMLRHAREIGESYKRAVLHSPLDRVVSVMLRKTLGVRIKVRRAVSGHTEGTQAL